MAGSSGAVGMSPVGQGSCDEARLEQRQANSGTEPWNTLHRGRTTRRALRGRVGCVDAVRRAERSRARHGVGGAHRPASAFWSTSSTPATGRENAVRAQPLGKPFLFDPPFASASPTDPARGAPRLSQRASEPRSPFFFFPPLLLLRHPGDATPPPQSPQSQRAPARAASRRTHQKSKHQKASTSSPPLAVAKPCQKRGPARRSCPGGRWEWGRDWQDACAAGMRAEARTTRTCDALPAYTHTKGALARGDCWAGGGRGGLEEHKRCMSMSARS